jgi:hypothetical protein
MPSRVSVVQQALKKKNLYTGKINGKYNRGTVEALEKLPALYPDILPDWSKRRKAYAFIQVLCLEAGFDPYGIDGLWGPNTEYAYDNYLEFLETGEQPEPWRPEEHAEVNPNNWPTQYTVGFDAFYGPKGSSQVRIHLPYSMKLAWNTSEVIHSFYCHAKVHDSLLRVLTKVLNHYGEDEIRRLRLDLWGGCYNERPIRGGTKWSMHSWAIAVDFDPLRNKLQWGRDKASFARPEYDKWWECWEEEGWVSLGRQRNFDWMHVQAAKL